MLPVPYSTSSNLQYLMKKDLGLAFNKGSSYNRTYVLSICNYGGQGGIVDDPLLLQMQLLLVGRLYGHATTRAHSSKLSHDGQLRRSYSCLLTMLSTDLCRRYACCDRKK